MAWPPVIPPNTRANQTAQLDQHPSDHNAIANALTDIVARVNPGAWTALPFAAGWANTGGAYAACMYRLLGDVVQLKGQATRASGAPSGTTVATMPAGYRPTATWEWAANGTGGLWAVGITSAGVLSIVYTTAAAPAFVDLSSLWWATT